MVVGHEGQGGPPYARDQLKNALALVALDSEKHPAIPYLYALDQLAQRWSTDPERLAEMDSVTLLRGLEFMRLEASVKVTGAAPAQGEPDPMSSPRVHAVPEPGGKQRV